MQLQLQNFSTLLATMAAGVQGAATSLLDLTVGSALRAILEANAAIGLWLQWLIVQVLGVTRAATSTGADLDSFVADFGVARLPAAAASGTVVLARNTPTLAAFVPVGAQIRSTDGSQSFLITADPTNAAWGAAPAGYTIGAGVGAIAVQAAATTPGSAGNILAGAASVLGSAIAGVDSVTNPSAFGGGLDPESDPALRARFALVMQSEARATKTAIAAAIASVQVGLSYVISENSDAAGHTVPGNFLVTLDDGSGAPSAGLIASVSTAVDAVRPVGSVFTVQAPQIATASVAMTLGLSDNTQRPTVTASVAAAITAYIEALPVGATLAYTRLAQMAYAASPLVTNVTSLLLDGGVGDLVVPSYGVVKAGTVTVS